jgi:hypothetical protein
MWKDFDDDNKNYREDGPYLGSIPGMSRTGVYGSPIRDINHGSIRLNPAV